MDDFLDMVNVSGGEVHTIFGLTSKSIKEKIWNAGLPLVFCRDFRVITLK
ncbi:MAG: hypothetical protein ACM3XO_04870 [Bacteroidota bacterium]|jgi:hypothetical protein